MTEEYRPLPAESDTINGLAPQEPTFGNILRQYRLDAGLSQNGLARRSGIDPTHYNRLERDKQGSVRMPTFMKLIGALGYELTDERSVRLLEKAAIHNRGQEGATGTVNNVVFEAKLHEAEQSALKAWQIVLELRTM